MLRMREVGSSAGCRAQRAWVQGRRGGSQVTDMLLAQRVRDVSNTLWPELGRSDLISTSDARCSLTGLHDIVLELGISSNRRGAN